MPEAAQKRKAQGASLKRKAQTSCISTHIYQKWHHSWFSWLILRVNWIPTLLFSYFTVVGAGKMALYISPLV